ncbi:hypothetical protein MRS44_012939 [Fusarium solani]|uniref:uncharacterized protein n=1 Tax=Fusarium solani TaxID=169388 RepID=UPI0032C46141|nr:hypothetical protein MRS44_012939 [Fusarium solani]
MLQHSILHAFSIGAALSTRGAAHYTNGTISEGCVKACSQLSTIFGPVLHYPSTDNFTIWDAKQLEVRPACRVEPSSAKDVAQILGVVVDNWCRFAVKGGGHSRHPDDSNSVGGVTIDLDKLNSIEPSVDGSSARVGGGASSGQVFRALAERNSSFVGGRVASVGIGGFTTGGGTSPFSNKYGWALDNVYEYEVVLANGTIVNANNFGIVTTFTIRTFPQGPIFSAQVSYGDNQTEAVLDKVYDLYTRPDLVSDLNMGYDLYYTYSTANDSFVMLGTQRYEQPIQAPPVFQEIDAIPPVSRNVRIGTLANLASNPPLGRTRNAIARMKQRGGNALGIDEKGPLFIILISTAWANAEGDGPVGTMTTNVVDRVKAAAGELGVTHPYIYVGYARAGQDKEVFAGYGEKNLRRLQEVQKSVDPSGVFTSHGLWRGHMKLL